MLHHGHVRCKVPLVGCSRVMWFRGGAYVPNHCHRAGKYNGRPFVHTSQGTCTTKVNNDREIETRFVDRTSVGLTEVVTICKAPPQFWQSYVGCSISAEMDQSFFLSSKAGPVSFNSVLTDGQTDKHVPFFFPPRS